MGKVLQNEISPKQVIKSIKKVKTSLLNLRKQIKSGVLCKFLRDDLAVASASTVIKNICFSEGTSLYHPKAGTS